MEDPPSPPCSDAAVSGAAAEPTSVCAGAQAGRQEAAHSNGSQHAHTHSPEGEGALPLDVPVDRSGDSQPSAELAGPQEEDTPPPNNSPGQPKPKATKAWDRARARPVFGPIRQPRLPEPGQRGFRLARTVPRPVPLQGTLLVGDTGEALGVEVQAQGTVGAHEWLQSVGVLLGCSEVQAHWAQGRSMWVLAGVPGSQAMPTLNRQASAVAGCRIFGDALLLRGTQEGRLQDYTLSMHAEGQ